MNSQEIFRKHKDAVVHLWVDAVFSTYPFETKGFLRTKQDPFGNPVAHMTKEAAAILYDSMAGDDVDVATVKNAIERFVKLRAVQTFTPSQGLGVFYLMKPIMREHLLPVMQEHGELTAYMTAESRLDSIVLLAFDIYTAARETLAESRITEIRNQYAQLKRWAQQLENGPVQEQD